MKKKLSRGERSSLFRVGVGDEENRLYDGDTWSLSGAE
jgi:hypothetical protein